jgi:hypothetical protein
MWEGRDPRTRLPMILGHEIRATEVAPTHEEKVTRSFIYAKFNNVGAVPRTARKKLGSLGE